MIDLTLNSGLNRGSMNTDRASAIRRHLFTRGQSAVAEIAEAVGASIPTVRRDLLALETEGAIVRTHGGARIADGSGVEVGFDLREQLNLAAKRAIGDAAFGLVQSETSIFLDAGTTVLQLARRIRLNPLRLRVFTNCLPVAQMLMGVPSLSITLLGGALRAQNASMVGMLAEEALDRLWFDHLFLGAGAIAPDGAICSADEQEARLNAHMIARTGRPCLLADSTKFGTHLTWRVAALGPAFQVISDDELPASWRSQVQESGATLMIAGRNP
jgi:DeoR/GlpR family transcriptional regulator of sugar metabolism